MKRKILVISALAILIGSFLILNFKTDTIAETEINRGDFVHLTITVYNSSGSQTISGALVIVSYGGSQVFSATSNSSGIVDFNMTSQPTGTYSINAYYPVPPNDSNSGSNTVYFNGGNTSASVNLTVFINNFLGAGLLPAPIF